MTTATTNTPVSNASSATFQAWITEMTTQLTAVGLTQTADTGQINPATVALPGTSPTVAGYQIWRFNDTLQATSPIFIKIEYGTGATVASPGIIISTGQGSNGSGTLTGTLTTRALLTPNTLNSTVTNAPAFWIYNATYGVLACAWKFGVNSSNVSASVPVGGFIIERSCDTNGNATGDAAIMVTPTGAAAGTSAAGNITQIYSYLAVGLLTPVSPTAALCAWSALWPMNPASSAVGANNQVMPRFHYTPNIQLSGTSGLCLASEFSMASTFTAALVGVTTKTYIALGNLFGISNPCAQTSAQVLYGYVLWQ